MGPIWLASDCTICVLSAAVKLELCDVMCVALRMVKSTFVSAAMTAKAWGRRPRKVPSKSLTAAVRPTTAVLSSPTVVRSWGARSWVPACGIAGRAEQRERNGRRNRWNCILKSGLWLGVLGWDWIGWIHTCWLLGPQDI